MSRTLLSCLGIVLGLAGETILWNGPDLYAIEDSWHSASFTRIVGGGVIVEGALAALGAALCGGRAIIPLTSAPTQSGTDVPGPAPAAGGGGPVLPICGMLFLLAAFGPFGQAWHNSQKLEVMDSMPGGWGADLVDDFRRHERTEWTFGALWFVIGGALLSTPLFLKPRVWQLGWRMNGVGCGIAVVGFLLSGLGAFVCVATGLTGEGASKEMFYAGYLGVLAGAIVAIVGSIVAVLGNSKP